VALGVGAQLAEEGLLELEDFLDVHRRDERLGGGNGRFSEHDALKFVVAGGKDGGALVDFGGIEQVEDGEMLNLEDLVHAFNAEPALPVEKLGDMSLLKA